MLFSLSFAQAQDCKYLEGSVGPATSENLVRTSWQNVTSRFASMDPTSARGSVQGISDGGAKYLGVRLQTADFYPLPREFNINPEDTNIITKKGIYDPRVTEFMHRVNVDALVVPIGSTLRITMEDRTTIVLRSTTNVAVRGDSTRPGNSNNSTPHVRTSATADLRYALDAEAIDALTNFAAINMRVETRDKYYSFESRMSPKPNAQWNKKSNFTIQRALKCVL